MTDNQNNELIQPIKHSIKYKESRAKWARENREKRNELAKIYYQAKITNKPEYREILNERTKARQLKLKDGQPTRPRGRPRKEIPENTDEPKPKKGRPRKY